jgi:hypothetical protein
MLHNSCRSGKYILVKGDNLLRFTVLFFPRLNLGEGFLFESFCLTG